MGVYKLKGDLSGVGKFKELKHENICDHMRGFMIATGNFQNIY